MAYNYTACFVAYCKGAPVEEIAEYFKIPLKSLKAKMRQEGWKSLADKFIGLNGPVPANTAETLTRIEANRAKNYETASRLRDELDRNLDRLEAGNLRVKKRFQYNGHVVECDAEPSIADLVQLATYARMVQDMTYRALGDRVALGGRQADAAAEAQPPSPPIQIILPAAISIPREKRAELARQSRLAQGDGETPGTNN